MTAFARLLAVLVLVALPGCLEPIAEDTDTGPDIGTLFEVAPGSDLGKWQPDAADDTPDTADAVQDAVDDASDVTSTDLPDGTTAADALPGDATASDAADDATGTTLPGDVTGSDFSLTCGDGKCVKADKENCKTCPDDCGDCPSICGDKVCQSDETCTDCPGDCGPCELVCSLFGSTNCGPLEQCYPDGKANLCGVAGSKSVGDACLYFNECQKGQLCVGGVCRAICDFSAQDKNYLCQPGVSCDKVNVPGKGGVNLGVCGF